MDEEIKKSILKTGTTILGIVCKDGIVMAADRQVTAGNLVVSKTTEKVYKINDYLVFAACGNASDAQKVSKLIAAELRLKALRAASRPTVKESANLLGLVTYSQIRQFTTIPSIVGTLVAGYNEDGTTELYTVEPAGSVIKVDDYDANFGSGMPYILGLLERQYKENLSTEEGVKLAIETLKSSTQRDMGSGYGIDVYVIKKDGIKKVTSQKIEPSFKDQ